MEKEKNLDQPYDAGFLKKAKRAVLMYRCFNWEIPGKYHRAMIDLQCCSEQLLQKYIKSFPIKGDGRNDRIANLKHFAECYTKSNLNMVISYAATHTCAVILTELIKLKDLNILRQVKADSCIFCANRGIWYCDYSVLQELINTDDPAIVQYVLRKFGDFKYLDKGIKRALAEEKIEIFKELLSDLVRQGWSRSNIEQEVLKSDKVDFYIAYHCICKFYNSTLLQILQGDHEELKNGMLKFQLPSGVIRPLIRANNISVLERYIQKFQLQDDDQVLLIRSGCASVVKLYQKQWGLGIKAMTYLSGLEAFEKIYDKD